MCGIAFTPSQRCMMLAHVLFYFTSHSILVVSFECLEFSTYSPFSYEVNELLTRQRLILIITHKFYMVEYF
jgi:fluoride ion exporter CrcB/FEX